jgi:hypothetical protein
MTNRKLTKEEVSKFNKVESDLQLIGITDSHYYFHSLFEKKVLYQEKSDSKVMVIAENIIGSSIQSGYLIMKDDNGVTFILQGNKKNIIQLDLDLFYDKEKLHWLSSSREKKVDEFKWGKRYLVLSLTWRDKIVSLIKKYDCEYISIFPLFLSESSLSPSQREIHDSKIFGWYIHKLKKIIDKRNYRKVDLEDYNLITYNKRSDGKFYYLFYNRNKKKIYYSKTFYPSFFELELPVQIEKVYQVTESSMAIIDSIGLCFLINDVKMTNNKLFLFAVTDIWLENNEGKEFSLAIDTLLTKKESCEKIFIAEIAYYDKRINLLVPKYLGEKLLVGFSHETQRYYYTELKSDLKNKLFYVQSSEFDYKNFKIIGKEESLKENDKENKILHFKHKEFSIIEFEHSIIDSYHDLQFAYGKIIATDSQGRTFMFSELSKEEEKACLIAINVAEKDPSSFPTNADIQDIIESDLYIPDLVITFKGESWIGWYNKKAEWKIDNKYRIFQFIELKDDDLVDDFYYLGLGDYHRDSKLREFNECSYVLNLKKKKLFKILFWSNEKIYEYSKINVLLVKDRVISLQIEEESENLHQTLPVIENFDLLVLSGCCQFSIGERIINYYKEIIVDFIGDNGKENILNIWDLPSFDFEFSSEGSDLIMKYKNSEIIITRYEREVSLKFNLDNKHFTLKHNSDGSDKPNLIKNTILSVFNN